MTKNDNKNNNKINDLSNNKINDLSNNKINDLSNNNFFNIIYNKNNSYYNKHLLLTNKPNKNNKPFKIKPNININTNINMSNISNNKKYKYNKNIFDIRNTLDLHDNNKFDFKNKKYKSKNDFYTLFEHLNKYDEKNKVSPFFLPTLMEEKKINIKIKEININVELNTLNDILDLIEKYPLKIDVKYNINMKAIHDIKKPVQKLNNMIGMKKLKTNIIQQIIYFIQNLHINDNSKENNDFMHTVIYGPPGTGKTEIAKIIGDIFSNIGILKKKTFQKVTRTDLIAGYLGQTAIKTTDIIKKSLGGVLFIDEAYALGNSEKKDSFAKECIDTLCEALSDHKNNLMVIIAGYEEDLNKCFFSYNQGLDSRFTWRFKTDDYNSEELFLIFKKKIKDIKWSLNEKISYHWFEDKMEYFKFYGRDIENLLAKIKISHSKRVFCLTNDKKKIINLKDMNNGYNMFLENDEVKKRNKFTTPNYMYI